MVSCSTCSRMLNSHTSDELYVCIQGDFTYIAEDGTAARKK
jgi:hypothetical protein